jgi:hypothetical protein
MGLAAAAGIAAVGGIASSVIGGSAAKSAANTQAAAADRAAELQNQQYQQTRADTAPWREAGGKAIGQLSDMLKPGYDYTTSPGYQFRFNEGQRAVEGSAAARGMLMSGGTTKALERYGQGQATSDFTDQFNRVASVAAGGQQTNATLGQLGRDAAQYAGDAAMQAGNARASGYVGQANAINSGIGNLTSLAFNSGLFGGGNNLARLTPSVQSAFAANPGIF